MPGFIVQGMGGGGGSSGVSSRRQYYYNYFWEVLNLFDANISRFEPLISLKDATLPTFTVNKETVMGASLEYKFAKSITWEDIKITWYDSEGFFPYVRSWRRMVWDQATGLQQANVYKRESLLHYFLPTGKRANQWHLINSWPSQIRNGDLTYTSSEVKLVEVTVSYDWAEETAG